MDTASGCETLHKGMDLASECSRRPEKGKRQGEGERNILNICLEIETSDFLTDGMLTYQRKMVLSYF